MRGLIFGTVYADTVEKLQLAQMWGEVNASLSPECTRVLVDSNSPVTLASVDADIVGFRDNIGHLARGGEDGWGRAFCLGLQYAVDMGFDYVAHVEGDSLFRYPVMPVFRQMHERQIKVASVLVGGTKMVERDWIETGLVMFNVDYLRRHEIVARYDWQNYKAKKFYPKLPEWHLHRIVREHLRIMPWSAERGDKGQIDVHNVDQYDWITHVPLHVAKAFRSSVLADD